MNKSETLFPSLHTVNVLALKCTIFRSQQSIFSFINDKFTKDCEIDNIVNEHIEYSFPKMKNVYVKLFNTVFNTGSIPDAWTKGIINLIYKNKGDPSNPENYRPITLLNCLLHPLV